MTNRTAQPVHSVHGGHPAQARRAARHEPDAARSVRQASIVGGAGILLLAVTAAFGNLVVVEGLVTQGDAGRTAEDIMASEGIFRLGIASLYLTVVLDVVVAWALFRVFRPVSTGMSRLAAWFRLAYSGVFMVAIAQLAGVPHLLGDQGYSAVFDERQLAAQAMLRVDAFNDIYFAGLILFGAHLVLLGYLAYRSASVPRVIGVLLVVAGLGYGFDSFGTVLSQGSPVIVSTVTFLGELLLALWLVVRGRRLSLGDADRGSS
jgi:hypothetical protein